MEKLDERSVAGADANMGCGSRCLKFSLFAFNFIFFIAGALCLAIGAWLILDEYSIDKIASAAEQSGNQISGDNNLRELADKPRAVREVGVVFAFGGGIVLLVAFLGCCGAVKEWRPLLVLYAGALMVILAIEISAASYAAVYRNKVYKDMDKLLQSSLKLYNGTDDAVLKQDQSNSMKIAWDKVMEEHKCCGITSTDKDFLYSPWLKLMRRRGPVLSRYPPACCPLDPTTQRAYRICPANARYSPGCYDVIVNALSSALSIVMWAVAAIAILQVVGIIFAFSLCRSIGEYAEYY